MLLDGLKHPTKYEKTSPLKATKEFFNEGKEIALTLMKNYDLIVQRVESLIERTNTSTLAKINSLQKEINRNFKKFEKWL